MARINVLQIRLAEKRMREIIRELNLLEDDLDLPGQQADGQTWYFAERLSEQVRKICKMADLLADITVLYETSERRIAAMFNLELEEPQATVFGTSHFWQLREHDRILCIKKDSSKDRSS